MADADIENMITALLDGRSLHMFEREMIANELRRLRNERNERNERNDAAAPELLDALKAMVAEWEKLARYGSPIAKAANENLAAARAAIAKATGAY